MDDESFLDESVRIFLDALSPNTTHPEAHLDLTLDGRAYVKRPSGIPPLATLLEHTPLLFAVVSGLLKILAPFALVALDLIVVVQLWHIEISPESGGEVKLARVARLYELACAAGVIMVCDDAYRWDYAAEVLAAVAGLHLHS